MIHSSSLFEKENSDISAHNTGMLSGINGCMSQIHQEHVFQSLGVHWCTSGVLPAVSKFGKSVQCASGVP